MTTLASYSPSKREKVKVRYAGNNRTKLKGLVGTVTCAFFDGSSGVTYPSEDIEIWSPYASSDSRVWAAAEAWEVVEDNKP